MMSFLKNLSDSLDKFSIYLLYAIGLVMVFCLIIIIVGRNFFNTSFASLEEFSRFSLIWMTFIGTAIAYKREEHIGIEFFISRFTSRTIKELVIIMKEIIALLLFVLLIYFGWIIMLANISTLSLQSNVPMSYIYVVLPLSGLILFIHSMNNLLKIISSNHISQ